MRGGAMRFSAAVAAAPAGERMLCGVNHIFRWQ
jgi:hypothetical protein